MNDSILKASEDQMKTAVCPSPAQDSPAGWARGAICSARHQLTPLTQSLHPNTHCSPEDQALSNLWALREAFLFSAWHILSSSRSRDLHRETWPPTETRFHCSLTPVLFPAPTHTSPRVFIKWLAGCKSTSPLFHKDHTYLVYHCTSLHMGGPFTSVK